MLHEGSSNIVNQSDGSIGPTVKPLGDWECKAVGCTQAGPPGFLSRIAQMLKSEAFITGDDIMITGEVGNEMFLLERGIFPPPKCEYTFKNHENTYIND